MKSVIAFGLALLGLSQSLPSSTNKEALELRDLVTVDGIFKHLEKFYEIGIPNSRSVRNGYNASAEYVISQLAPYCQTYTQSFVVPVHQQLRNPTLSLISPYTTTFQHGVDFQGMRYGGDGFHNFTASVSHVISGCKDQDYVGFTRGHIALIQEGGGVCELVDKALMAEKFGASAILFYNQQTRTSLLTSRVRYVEWKFGDALVRKPVLAISNLLGKLLLETPYPKVSLMADMLLTQDYTFNIFCDTKSGDKNNIVMAGAHLDSVPEGPGINDNGSGSATLLEIALQFFKNGLTNTNAIRFAWWGAEEIGLLGSRHYVRELKKTPEQLEKIALYMNFDMLGSPNFTPQIHDGYKTSSAIPPEVKKASSRVQNVFEQYFEEESLPYQLIDMVAGSDFVPFIEAGIPSSGMATGASSLKSDEERTTFGGLANAEYDPCYHLPCDTVLNISKEGIRQVSESTASTIQKLANIQNLRGYLYG